MPPLNNQRTLSLGIKYSPEGLCIPFKLTLGNLIDAITGGVIAQNVVPNLEAVPQQFLPLLFEQLGYTPEELANLYVNAERMLLTAGIEPTRRAETLSLEEWGQLAACWSSR